MQFPSDEPVRYVDMVLDVFRRCVALQEVADGDFQIREILDFLAPFIISVHVWKGDHITAKEDFQSLVELALSSCG